VADVESIEKRLGDRCIEVRKQKGLSRKDLVRRFGWSLSHYQRIERCAADPRFSTMLRLAESLGIPVSELVEGF
jgi:transcriptional regulator with XRE-family HTH domain